MLAGGGRNVELVIRLINQNGNSYTNIREDMTLNYIYERR